jgi:hypothetical protein
LLNLLRAKRLITLVFPVATLPTTSTLAMPAQQERAREECAQRVEMSGRKRRRHESRKQPRLTSAQSPSSETGPSGPKAVNAPPDPPPPMACRHVKREGQRQQQQFQ